MLTFEDKIFGIQECALDLAELYPDIKSRHNFHSRLEEFIESDEANQQIIFLQGDKLKYYTEVFVSDRIDDRLPLLLLLGNPASHSTISGMCFAFEKNGREHRFWKALSETGILTFSGQQATPTDHVTMNKMRRDSLLELRYQSQFRVGIAVFYSLPSTTTDARWSGVSGVKRLFGAKAFDLISVHEEQRLEQLISKFIGQVGGIIAFQKDSYNRVKSQGSPTYSRYLAIRGLLRGKYKFSDHIFLTGSPPTRLMHTKVGKTSLLSYKTWLCEQLSL